MLRCAKKNFVPLLEHYLLLLTLYLVSEPDPSHGEEVSGHPPTFFFSKFSYNLYRLNIKSDCRVQTWHFIPHFKMCSH